MTKAESVFPDDGTQLILKINYNAIPEPSGMIVETDNGNVEIRKLSSLSEIPPNFVTIQEIEDQLNLSLEACNNIRHTLAG